MSHIIDIEHLKKSFNDIHAVDDISFHVREGELFAFLGLNGAGKSTTISILCGQLQKDAGSVCIDGCDIDQSPDKIKAELGLVFQDSVLDSVLTVRDNLKVRAALYGITGAAFEQRMTDLANLLHLQELQKRPIGKLSGGQRRRVDIARALVHQPRILILDEPTTGLDPQSRIMVWNALDHLRRDEGLTVFLTTHYMEEASEADYVVILDSGKIVAEGTPHDLKDRYAGDFIKLYRADTAELDRLGIAYTLQNGYVQIAVTHTAQAREMIQQYPALFEDFEVVKGKMDDVFLAATGKELKEA